MTEMSTYLKDAGLKVVLAFIAPAAQFVWVRLKQRNREYRVRDLRDKLKQLNDFLASAAAFGDTPEAEQVRAEAIQERNQLLSRLAQATKDVSPSSNGAVDFVRLPMFRRALLLYKPKRSLAWFGQSLFFLLLAAMVLTVVGIVASWDEEGGVELLGAMIVYAVLTFGAHALTTYSDRPVQSPRIKRSRLRSWFLLFKPRGVTSWLLHSTFYLILLSVVAGTFGVAATWNTDPDASDALWGFAILIAVALIVRAVALSRDTVPAAATAPPSRIFPTICFVYSLFMLGAAIYGAGTAFDRDFDLKEVATFVSRGGNTLWFLFLVILFSITSLGWRQSIPREAIVDSTFPVSSRVRQLFLAYRPTRPLGWIVRMLAICTIISAPMSVFAFLPEDSRYADSDDAVLTFIFIPLMGALSLLAAQRWATLLEVSKNLNDKTQSTALVEGGALSSPEEIRQDQETVLQSLENSQRKP